MDKNSLEIFVLASLNLFSKHSLFIEGITEKMWNARVKSHLFKKQSESEKDALH